MTRIVKPAAAAVATLVTLAATALPAAAQYPPSPNVRGREIVAPDSTLSFTGADLTPLTWAVALFAVGVVLLLLARRTTSSEA